MNTKMPAGFRYAGVHAGIKTSTRSDRKDIALIVSDCAANTAGVFTTNKIQAAPVQLCRERIREHGQTRAVFINSGNANACTGQTGFHDAARTAQLLSGALSITEQETLVCSTGTIGIPLPMDRIEKGIRLAVQALGPENCNDAAAAIMTTDTRPKQALNTISIGGKPVSIYGMAKGSGMIHPNMATMLAFIMTDADIEQDALEKCLLDAVDKSFNRITVDGDQSTNDTVLVLANGKAGNERISVGSHGWREFNSAVEKTAKDLARMIVEDGEGATRFVNVNVRDAASASDASMAANAVAKSLLVKTAWNGADPNWGRVMAAIGYSGAELNEADVSISYDDLEVVKNGVSACAPEKDVKDIISKREFTLTVSLGAGTFEHSVYSCDISHEYVNINASYMT